MLGELFGGTGSGADGYIGPVALASKFDGEVGLEVSAIDAAFDPAVVAALVFHGIGVSPDFA